MRDGTHRHGTGGSVRHHGRELGLIRVAGAVGPALGAEAAVRRPCGQDGDAYAVQDAHAARVPENLVRGAPRIPYSL